MANRHGLGFRDDLGRSDRQLFPRDRRLPVLTERSLRTGHSSEWPGPSDPLATAPTGLSNDAGEKMTTVDLHSDLSSKAELLAQAQSAFDRAQAFKMEADAAIAPATAGVDDAVLAAADGDAHAPVKAARALAEARTVAESAARAVELRRPDLDAARKAHGKVVWLIAEDASKAARGEIDAMIARVIAGEIASLSVAVDAIKEPCADALRAQWAADHAKGDLGLAVVRSPFINDEVLTRSLHRLAAALPEDLKRLLRP
jgi:hypothetical protein